jgi:DNA-binding transcriptional ArsR family regulator
MDQPDPTIHQPVRTRIMAALKGLPAGEKIEFVPLLALVKATEGNLGSHLSTLEQAGYVAVEKIFEGKKPKTRVALTRTGRKAFDAYVGYLKDLIDGA